MTPPNLFDAYRRVLGTTGDDEVWWWYFGTMSIELEGMPVIPIIHAETIMAYRLETLSPDSFRINWREIGCFRDTITGEGAREWINPITGARIATPRTFEEGPGSYTITRAGDGVKLEIVQPHATIQRTEVTGAAVGNRLHLTQSEWKIRGFPQRDGSLPDPSKGAQGHTVLSFFAETSELSKPWADAAGIYSFTLDALVPWVALDGYSGRTAVRGVIQKARPTDEVNPTARARLRAAFPKFFPS